MKPFRISSAKGAVNGKYVSPVTIMLLVGDISSGKNQNGTIMSVMTMPKNPFASLAVGMAAPIATSRPVKRRNPDTSTAAPSVIGQNSN
ncbi:hypothetical protein D3C86_1979040 [compost metagenome]